MWGCVCCLLCCLLGLVTSQRGHYEQPVPIRPAGEGGRYDGGARRPQVAQPRPAPRYSDRHPPAYPQAAVPVQHQAPDSPHHVVADEERVDLPAAEAEVDAAGIQQPIGQGDSGHGQEAIEEYAAQAEGPESVIRDQDVVVEEDQAAQPHQGAPDYVDSPYHPKGGDRPQPRPQHAQPPPRQQQQQRAPPARDQPVLMHNPPHVKSAGPPSEYDLSDEEYRQYHEKMPLFHEEDQGGDEDGLEAGVSGRSVLEDWTHMMEDFLPDMFVTFALPARGEEYFYQDFGSEPTRLRGAFFIAGADDFNNKTGTVKLRIIDPKGQPVFEHRGGERVFNVVTKEAGTYTVFFANPAWVGHELRVTAVIGSGNETTLKMENVHSVHDNVLVLARMIRDIQAESKYLWSRQKAQMTTVAHAHSGIIWVSILELVAVIVLSACQIFFLKSLVSHRRIF